VRVKFDLSVLYVEDEESIRETMLAYFQRRFEKVYFAVNGEDGLKKYRELKPDIIIADIEMPILDGLKMSETIRATDTDVAIVFTTAFNEPEQLHAAAKLNAMAYLEKPIDYDELEGVITEIAERLIVKC
jgi:YesN/AraC family two-component response regulator